MEAQTKSQSNQKLRDEVISQTANNLIIAKIVGVKYSEFDIWLDSISPEYYAIILEALNQKRGKGKNQITLGDLLLMSK